MVLSCQSTSRTKGRLIELADDAYGATIAKRMLSRHLANFRVATGYTANHVCDLLNWGRGKVGRIEANTWKTPDLDDVRELLRLYGVTGINFDETVELTMLARANGWWRDFPEIFDNDFLGYENDAVTIRTSAPLVLPELMQTRAYVESTLQGEIRSPAWRRKALQARLRRQEILNGSHPLALSAVIAEASLWYRWGTYGDRREQIDHLIEMAEQSNIHIRIQRFDDGPPIGANSIVNIFGFDGIYSDVIFVGADYSGIEVVSQDLADLYAQSFADACERALDPDDTLRYLKRIAKGPHFGSQQVILMSSRYPEKRELHSRYFTISDTGEDFGVTKEEVTSGENSSSHVNRISVAAYLDGSPYAMRQVLDRVDKLVRALGYGDPIDEEIESGSIFRRYFASIRKGFSSAQVQERASKAERALELLTIDSKQAQVDGQAAAAVQSLVSSLSEIPTACVRVGSILLVKYTSIDGAVVLVRTLSQAEIRALERFPEIQRRPDKVLDALAFAVAEGESSIYPHFG
jgi:hypothetical protein